jgi:hypothetical protein
MGSERERLVRGEKALAARLVEPRGDPTAQVAVVPSELAPLPPPPAIRHRPPASWLRRRT